MPLFTLNRAEVRELAELGVLCERVMPWVPEGASIPRVAVAPPNELGALHDGGHDVAVLLEDRLELEGLRLIGEVVAVPIDDEPAVRSGALRLVLDRAGIVRSSQ